MKTMTCRQLGGACDKEFNAETFDEMAELSRQHGTEMFINGDKPHIRAMNEMQKLMQSPDAMKKWIESKHEEFNSLPDH